jgi:hypothetical protein
MLAAALWSTPRTGGWSGYNGGADLEESDMNSDTRRPTGAVDHADRRLDCAEAWRA